MVHLVEYILNQAQNWLGSPAAHKLGIMADACNPHFQGFTLSIMSSSLPLAIWQLPEYPGVREGHGAQSQNKKKPNNPKLYNLCVTSQNWTVVFHMARINKVKQIILVNTFELQWFHL